MKRIIALLISVMLFAAGASAEKFGLTNFVTKDMDGNEVTQEVFASYDLTMVNVWGTWCGYCVEEMPEFHKLVDMLPENANFITLCEDAAFEPELTQEILDQSNANFQTLICTNDIYNNFLYNVSAFPTTFFMNSAGEVVGEPIVGVPSLTNAAEAYYQIFAERLAALEG